LLSQLSGKVGGLVDLDRYGRWENGKFLTNWEAVDAMQNGPHMVVVGVSGNVLDTKYNEVIFVKPKWPNFQSVHALRVIREDMMVDHLLALARLTSEKLDSLVVERATKYGAGYYYDSEAYIRGAEHGRHGGDTNDDKHLRLYRKVLYVGGATCLSLVRQLRELIISGDYKIVKRIAIANLGGYTDHLQTVFDLLTRISSLCSAEIVQYGPLFSCGAILGIALNTKGAKYVHGIRLVSDRFIKPYKDSIFSDNPFRYYGRDVHEFYLEPTYLIHTMRGKSLAKQFLNACESGDDMGNFLPFRV
jgi:hypothetical protein